MKKPLTLLVLLFTALGFCRAQEETTSVHRYLGIGIRSSPFQVSEMPVNLIPSNRLLININPMKYLRAEFHFGIYESQTQHQVTTYPSGTTQLNMQLSSSLAGGGIFGIYPKGNVRFIAGVRYSVNTYSRDNLYYPSTPPGNPIVVPDRGKINIVAPMIGAEYFLNKWFSLGAEFSIVHSSDVFTPWDRSELPTTTTTTVTESGLVFRFYPY